MTKEAKVHSYPQAQNVSQNKPFLIINTTVCTVREDLKVWSENEVLLR